MAAVGIPVEHRLAFAERPKKVIYYVDARGRDPKILGLDCSFVYIGLWKTHFAGENNIEGE